MQEREVWRAIPTHEGRYEVSNLGRVRSLLRGGRILKAHPNVRGYPRVPISIDGKVKLIAVHQLVLLAFVGPRPDGMVACHGNDVPSDNRLENLRWDTPAANYAQRHERERVTGIGPTVLTEEQAVSILLDQRSSREAAAHYGVSADTIRDIRSGRRWKHLRRTAVMSIDRRNVAARWAAVVAADCVSKSMREVLQAFGDSELTARFGEEWVARARTAAEHLQAPPARR